MFIEFLEKGRGETERVQEEGSWREGGSGRESERNISVRKLPPYMCPD